MFDLSNLNTEQITAVQAINGPVIVFAGAGTGKTRTLTSRIAYMIKEKRIKAHKILAITFTKKATEEMRQRIIDTVGIEAGSTTISTIHSFCARILRKHIGLIGYTVDFEIIDDEDGVKILSEIYKERNIDRKAFSPKASLKAISSFKNQVSDLFGHFEKIYQYYQQYLKENNLVDFDDLLIHASELFRSFPDVLAHYQNKFEYILVDEFQDTNRTQYEIIKMLGLKKQNVFVVGDDDQSIYSFRGAVVDNMYAFMKDFDNVQMIKLTQNYRSTNEILQGANALIAHNLMREKKELFSLKQGEPDDIVLTEANYYEDEIRYVTNEILSLLKQGIDEDQIAVLYRNNVIARGFELAFVQNRINYKLYGGFSYLKRREIKDIISYLRFIIEPNNMFHFRRIINQPTRGIGNKTIEKVQERMIKAHENLFDAIDFIATNHPSAKHRALLEFKTMIIELQAELEKYDLVDFFDVLLDKTEYLKMLESEDDVESNRVANLKEFKSILYRLDNLNEGQMSKRELLRIGFDEILLDETLSIHDSSKGVVLSTIHSAKGLEFDAVFVVALEEGLFPATREESDLEEERRIAYVAFTRAKTKLYLSCATSRLIYGRIVRNLKSRFLTEFIESRSSSVLVNQQLSNAYVEQELKVADKIHHAVFGMGIIIAINERTVQVLFEKDKSLRKLKKDHPSIKKY